MTEEKKFVSEEECAEFATLMQGKNKAYLNDRYFSLSVSNEKDAVFVKVILRNSSDSFYYPVEGRLALDENKVTAREAALMMIDYIDAYFEEYLVEEVFIPIDWTDYSSNGANFQMKGQVLDLKAEKMADELLKK